MIRSFTKYITLSLFIAYIFVAYIDWYIDWHNKNVVSILSQFKSNIWMQLLTGVLIVIAGYDLKSKYQLRYHYDWKVILPLFLVSILLAYYRFFTERYNYIYWICPVYYVDVIYSFGFLYSIVASVNYYRTYRIKCIRNKEKSPKDVIFLDFLCPNQNYIITPLKLCYKLLDWIFTILHIDDIRHAILNYCIKLYKKCKGILHIDVLIKYLDLHPLKALDARIHTILKYYRLCRIKLYKKHKGILHIIDVLRHTILKYYRLRRIKLYKKYKGNNSTCEILDDYPIETKEEDIFEFEDEVTKILEKIKKHDREKSFSISITGAWGTGKTSFMNLVKENINKKDFEIVRFNPRDCKSFQTIQEEFFTTIACVLSKYDSRCSNTIKDYMASLQLIDNRGIIEKLTSFYQIWNKVELKESIEKSFASLNKRVLVMIDDFDRLSKAEIFEVLKLIDSNAAFTNLIFLTAYDKVQVNKMLGNDYETKDACFVDKFFNSEFAIPLRPYSYISSYIEEYLLPDATDDEKADFHKTITKQESIFKDYIPTLRDAKRYINQFRHDYKGVRGDVVVKEFLLVQLIKYRYPDQYKSLFKKEYVEEGGIIYGNMNILYLKKDIDKKLNIYTILNTLFSTDNDNNSYKHVYDIHSFDNYFVNRIYSSLRIKDMKNLFSLQWDKVKNTIDEWNTNEDKSKDFTDYLDSYYIDNLGNGSLYFRYMEMLAYLAYKKPISRAYELFMKVIQTQNLYEYHQKYRLDFTNYKNRLLEIIEGNAPQLFTRIHYEYKTLRKNEDEYLIKDNDIWPLIKKKFIQTTKDDSADDDNLINWLYRCIDNMEETTRKIFLDKECLKAYRQRVEKNPDYYIKTFVRLGLKTSRPDLNSIVCEPFWEQIFGNKTQFEAFLTQCKKDNIEKSELAWNFWLLYKANNYKPIEFENQGNVQEKIDNNLVEEIKKLEEMQKIEVKVYQIPDNCKSNQHKVVYKKFLLKYKKELDDITLNISLNGKIRKAIDEKIKKLGIFE
ncbi:KAP family P-loop domain-containing protein [Bacteroidales bacterium KHT7]|nr:KAP family P-loop domain-containing protein [Bacteroidales bacterium KHT7]